MDRPRTARPARPWRRLAAVLAAALVIGGGLTWLGVAQRPSGPSVLEGSTTSSTAGSSPSAATAGSSTSPTATPTAPTSPPTARASTDARALTDPAVARRDGLTRLLAARSAAVAHRDAEAFLATVDPSAKAYRAQQATLFANLRRLAPDVWRYDYAGDGGEVAAEVATRLGHPARLVKVVLHYRLGPVDPADVVRQQWVIAVERDGRWLLAGSGDDATGAHEPDAHESEAHESDVDVWDLGPVTVARGAASLVVARSSGANGARLRSAASYVAEADRAVTRVGAVWTGRWTKRVVVVVPASQHEMARVLGEDGAGLDQIAAVTTGRVSGRPGPPTADRVVLNPAAYGDLGTLGRRVVLTHEVTHVATRASTVTALPLWFTEGFADYVGYSGTDVPVRVAASDVIDAVRAGRVPSRLPADEDFDPARGEIAPAYEQAWLAMRMVAKDGTAHGESTLVRLYRAAATSTGQGPEAAVDVALKSVLSVDRAAFLARWQGYLEDLARS